MIVETWHEFWAEHKRQMIELSIGQLIPNKVHRVDLYKLLHEFAPEVNALITLQTDHGERLTISVPRDPFAYALSLLPDGMTQNELHLRLLCAFIGMYTDDVVLMPSKRKTKRRKPVTGRIVTEETLITDALNQMQVEGYFDPASFAPLIEGEIIIPSSHSKRKLAGGVGKKGSRRRRDQIRRRMEREAAKAERAERRARGEIVTGRRPSTGTKSE